MATNNTQKPTQKPARTESRQAITLELVGMLAPSHVSDNTRTATVHNLRHERMRPGDMRIDRRTEFGNEFIIGRDGNRREVIAKFETAERARLAAPDGAARRAKMHAMHGKRLFCWCAPLACHGDVLARLAAELVRQER